MDTVERTLDGWRANLVESIPIAGLLSRNPIAYKWKGPFRCWVLREATCWRLTDLLTQSLALHRQKQILGARILLRSGLETLAYLIYLNQLIQQVLDEKLSFHEFDQRTVVLVAGSRDGSTPHQSLNIMTILSKCDKRYPGIERLYAILSESSHPNFQGLITGYSKVSRTEFETRFSNRWDALYGNSHLGSMELCIMTFEQEYNVVWTQLMEALEHWIVQNDTNLEATKPV